MKINYSTVIRKYLFTNPEIFLPKIQVGLNPI